MSDPAPVPHEPSPPGAIGPKKTKEPLLYALPRFSVHRPVTVLMILLSLMVVGFIAFRRIPVALFPEGMESSSLWVSVPYPNATPRDVEEKIIRKIEEHVATVPKVKKISSSSNAGNGWVRVEFQPGTDLKEAYAVLRDRMDRARPDLPEDVDRIYVRRFDQNDEPIIALFISLPPQVDDPNSVLEHVVKPSLQRIEGVGNVDTWGLQSRQVQIELDEERLRAHRVEVTAIVQALRAQNFALSGGYVMQGERKIYVRSLGRFTTPEQMSELIIDPVHRLRLRDVAWVGYRASKRDMAFRVDSQPVVGIQITRESTGNIERISREVMKTLAEIEKSPQLAGAKFNVTWDQGKHVRQSIANLEEAGLWGGLFAALIIYAFLRAPRMTGILTLSIPVSLLSTLIVLYFMDWSLNMATMMGLLLAVGMVVDNSIVIVENIYRYRQQGMDATKASISGAGEVGLAVVMSTCTNVVVFLPLMLMGGGDMPFWMLRIGVPVIVSILASLVIALVFVPLAAQRYTRSHRDHEVRLLAWVRERYLRCLRWTLHRRLDATVLVLLAMATLPIASKGVRFGGGGGGPDNMMFFGFEMPSGQPLEKAEAFFTSVESYLLANKEKYNFARIETRIRASQGNVRARFNDDPHSEWYAYAWDSFLKSGMMQTPFMQKLGLSRKPEMTREEIESDFRKNFLLPPGVTMRSFNRGPTPAAPQDSVITLNLYGEDTGMLGELAAEVVRRLREIPGFLSVDTDVERGGSELQIRLDRDRARQLGVNPQTVSGNISYAVRGVEAGRYYAPDGRELRIQMQLAEADRTGLSDVRGMTVTTEGGVEVPLETMAKLSVARTLGQISRESRQTVMRVSARVPNADRAKLRMAIETALKGFDFPRGYRWDLGQSFNQDQEAVKQTKLAAGLAIVFVFLLMGILFESFILPFAVIISIPLAALGVFWTLNITDTPMSIMAQIGMVILVGVVVNNAIVLIDMVNRLRLSGVPRFDALIEAGRHRLRPILMTTFVTVSGLIPMALGNSKMVGMPYAPLGRTMIGGLLSATFLTLIVVPLFYTFFDDLRGWAMSVFQSGGVRKAEDGPAIPKPVAPLPGQAPQGAGK